jgi:hypothetical protein
MRKGFMLDIDQMRELAPDDVLDNFLTVACESVKQQATGQVKLHPMLAVLVLRENGDHDVAIIPIPFVDEHRYAMMFGIGQMLVTQQRLFPIMAAWSSEAWGVHVTDPELAMKIKKGETHVKAAEHPDRQELICVAAQTADGRACSAKWPILRSAETDPIVLGPLEASYRKDRQNKDHIETRSDLLTAFFSGVMCAADDICRGTTGVEVSNEPAKPV